MTGHKKDDSPFEEPHMDDLSEGGTDLVRWLFIIWIVSGVFLVVLGLVIR